MLYKFRYKRYIFYREIEVSGHNYVAEQNKMILYLPDGGFMEISNWNKCSAKLGVDWVLAVKKHMESKTGQTVPLTTVK